MENLTANEIKDVLRGYAAGDSFGVAFEFTEFTADVDPDVLREKEGWPFGGVSDDTLLTLLTIQALDISSPSLSAENFLTSLRLAVPQLRGLGPTTRSALGLPVKEHELSQVGISNGALMRTALLGLAFRDEEAKERRAFVRALARATHSSPTAIGCALIGSALFADARSHSEENSPYDIALRELAAIDIEISLNDWREPICTGVSNDSTETLNAVLWTVKTSNSARDTLQIASELGGDTDTVAALSTALLIARKRAASDFISIPWLSDIAWEEINSLPTAADRLYQIYREEKVIR